MRQLGRPKEHRQTAILSVSIEASLKVAFAKIAERESKPVSEIAEDLIQEYVKNHGDGNFAFLITKWVDEPNFVVMPTIGEILKPERLDKLTDEDFEDLQKQSKAREQEISAAAQRRYEKKFGKLFHSGTKAARPPWND